MRTIELTAPSHWASYLINGDSSGLTANELKACEQWIDHLSERAFDGAHSVDCIDCSDAGFLWNHDANEFALACDCQFYTFQIKGEI